MTRRILASFLMVALTTPIARADEPAPPVDEPVPAPPVDDPAPPPPPPPAPTGTLTGAITDASTQLGLPAATIQITGAGTQALATELDGTFTITLAPGRYTVVIATPTYLTQTRTVTIVADRPATLTVALSPEVHEATGETVEVYSTIDTTKASAVLAERRAAATVSDAVSAEQIARSPDSSASDAAKRMVAATIQDNRYVVIRGLGGRYSLTLLNGVPLPSPDPDVPAAPLDLFPSALIANLTVQKTFSPDMPGNFAGGALTIDTRTYPSKFLFRAKVGVASDSASSWRSVNGQDGGRLDLFGFDDGTRTLPSSIPTTTLAGDYRLTAAQREAEVAGFKNNWSLQQRTAGPNLAFAATMGDTTKVGDQRLGYVANVSFGHSSQQRRTHLARVGGDDGAGGTLPSVLQLDDRQGIESANLGALGAVGWTPRPGHKLDLFGLYAHSGDVTSSEITGTDSSTAVIDRTRLQFLERELGFLQLVGEDRLADHVILEWQGNVAHVAQHEPDTRDLLRTETTDGRLAIAGGSGSAERLFGELSDTTLGGAAAVRLPFDAVKLKAGVAIQRSARAYQQRRFHFDLSGDTAFMSPDEAFMPEHAGNGVSMYEATLPSDGYDATRTVTAAFAMADVNPTAKLRVVGGARVELSRLDVGLASNLDLMTPPEPRTQHGDDDVLPSVNATYALTSAMNLRAAYAMTVARPNFREIAPALYYDYVRRRAIGGNPALAETTIHNGDLRWEQFLGDNEVIAASVFAKQFHLPIEKTVENAGDGDNVGFTNAPDATSYGVELEARLSLARLAPALAAFSVGGNLSLIGSKIETVAGAAPRPLQGQSPYVANLGLGYASPTGATRADVLFNTFGRRIEEVGNGGAGNIYEEPFHRLDLTFVQDLGRGLRLKLSGTNLLNRRVVRTQDAVEIFAYQVGVTAVGNLEFTLP
ncbi:MAG: TonB-dependent receptor [Proteobacteria bacterium]|nr:TonB-dependent receptor [Pseudomonadota bacterium]